MIILKYLWLIFTIIWILFLVAITVVYILDSIDKCKKIYEKFTAANVIDYLIDKHEGIYFAWFTTIFFLFIISFALALVAFCGYF